MTKTILGLLFLSTASLAAVIDGGRQPNSRESTPATAPSPSPLDRESFFEDTLAPSVKPPQYDLTIVEYSDYQCPFCRNVHPVLKQLLAKDKKVRLVYRDWPIFGDASVAAARVAIASQWQGKHAAVHDALMNTPRPLDDASIKRAAIKAGVDWSRLQVDMKKRGGEIDALLDRNNQQAEALGLQGTPAMIVGDYLIEGGTDLAGLQLAVKKARAHPGGELKPALDPEGI